MKTLALLFVVGVLAVALLRSDLTPWRLVSQKELDELRAAHAQISTQRAQQQSSAWMLDPNYRTSLEKTTVVGVPERSKRRER
jgi:hypothetical protein